MSTQRPSVQEEGGAYRGPAFPMLLRVLATLTVSALAVQAARTARTLDLSRIGPDLWLLSLLAASVVLGGLLHILMAHTSLEGGLLREAGLWRRQTALHEARRIELLHLPGLAWLVAPRIRVHTARGILVFHATHPQLLQHCWALALSPTGHAVQLEDGSTSRGGESR